MFTNNRYIIAILYNNFNLTILCCLFPSLQVSDLTPNMGLFWYFFTEMFEHFRNFFLWVFQLNAFFYCIPLTIKLRYDIKSNLNSFNSGTYSEYGYVIAVDCAYWDPFLESHSSLFGPEAYSFCVRSPKSKSNGKAG